jgi:Autophagy-related protein 101
MLEISEALLHQILFHRQIGSCKPIKVPFRHLPTLCYVKIAEENQKMEWQSQISSSLDLLHRTLHSNSVKGEPVDIVILEMDLFHQQKQTSRSHWFTSASERGALWEKWTLELHLDDSDSASRNRSISNLDLII